MLKKSLFKRNIDYSKPTLVYGCGEKPTKPNAMQRHHN